MQKDNLTQAQFRQLLDKTLQLISGSNSDRDSLKVNMFASIIKNMSYFQRNIEAPANLYDFTQLAKYHLNYEVHPYGTVLKKDGDYSEKFSIVLKGNALKLIPRPYEEIDKEIKKRNPPAPKQDPAATTKSQTEIIVPKRTASRYRQHTIATSKKVGIGRTYVMTMNKLRGDSFEETPKANNKMTHARTVSNLDDVQKNKPTLSQAPSLNDLDWNDNNQGKEDNGSVGSAALSERGTMKRLDTIQLSKSLYHMGSLENLDEMDYDDEMRREEIAKRIKARKEMEKKLKLDELIMTEEDVQFLEYVASNCPDIRPKLFLADVLKVRKAKIYKQGEHFGDNYYKEVRQRENYSIIANSEEVHLLTFSRESYQAIMTEICEQAREKSHFFIDMFPSFELETVKKFSYNFSERHFKRNERIFEENDPAQELYLLKSGQVQLFKSVDPASQLNQGIPSVLPTNPKQLERVELPVASIIKHQFFGEEVVLREPARRYTAVAINSGTVAFFVEPRVYHSVKEEFGELLNTLKQQTKDRFVWRHQRTIELIEQKKQQTTKAYFDAAKLDKGFVSKPQATQSNATFTVPVISKMSKVNDSIKHKLSDDIITSEDQPRDLQHIRGLVLKTNKVLVVENSSVAKNLDLYRTKYSRKTQIDKANVEEDMIFKRRAERPRLNTDIVTEPNPFTFNIRRELNSKKSNKTKLPQLTSFQYIGSAQELDGQNTSLVKEHEFESNNFVHQKSYNILPKSTVLDLKDDSEENEGSYRSKLREMIQGSGFPSSVRGMMKKMEESPFTSLKGTTSPKGLSSTNIANIHVARLPKKLTTLQKAMRKISQERVESANFDGITGKKTELQLKGIY